MTTSKTSLELFRSFDVVFEAETARPEPTELEQSVPRLLHLINALPQRGAIRDNHVDRWLDRTVRMAFDRMTLEKGEGGFSIGDVHRHVMWHIRRASGFGGSEAGAIVEHFRGKKGDFTNARNLVMEKLLILSPQPSTDEMARGVRAEPWIQKIYQQATGYRTDHEALGLLRGFRWSGAPFLVGTPDDIVIKQDGKRRMADYKAPSADVCSDYEKKGSVSFSYTVQLHHYGILSLAAGCRFEDMSIEVLDPRSFTVVSYPTPFDRELAKEIASSSRVLWEDYVMQGLIPDAPEPDELRSDDPALIAMAHEAAMFRVMKDMIEAREKGLIERIAILGTDMHDKAEGKLSIGVADYSRSRTWDVERLIALAEAAGIDPEAFMEVNKKKKDADKCLEIVSLLVEELRAGGDTSAILEDLARDGVPDDRSLNASNLAAALAAEGIDTLEAAGIKGSFGLTRKKKGPGAEALGVLRNTVSELIDALDEVVSESAQRIIQGENEPEILPEME